MFTYLEERSEGKGRDETGRGVGKESGESLRAGEGMEGREMGMHEKIGDAPWGATAPCHTFLESSRRADVKLPLERQAISI